MAQFDPAFAYLMNWEDPRHEFAVQTDACPSGAVGPCYACSGINSGAWPDDFARIKALAQDERGPAVAAFYKVRYWTVFDLDTLDFQDLANRVLDQGVNGGYASAGTMLQKAVNALTSGVPLKVDGKIGPQTIAAANAIAGPALLSQFRAQRSARVEALLAGHPERAVYAENWRTRANA